MNRYKRPHLVIRSSTNGLTVIGNKESGKLMQNEKEMELFRKLRDLQDENKRLRIENNRLKKILESFSIKPASSLQLQEQTDGEKPVSNEEAETEPNLEIDKVRLFRDFFRGREDVFAVRWENRSKKSGYSPACAN